MSSKNQKVRLFLEKHRIRYYEAAAACGVTAFTFSRWLQIDLPEERQNKIIDNVTKAYLSS